MNNEMRKLKESYSAAIAHEVGGMSSDIERAFQRVPRERFVGDGPWYILKSTADLEYDLTPTTDLTHIYQNVFVALDRERKINNGLPSWQALNLATMEIKKGERITHIGAGVGYYTALLAELVGAQGSVFGVEYESALYERARENLSSYKNVRVVCGDGSRYPLPASDVIYVNAGASEIQKSWIEALNEGGRLFFPLTYDMKAKGRMVLIQKREDRFSVCFTHDVYIYPCIGSTHTEKVNHIRQVFESKGYEFQGELCFDPQNANESCYLKDDWYWLSSTTL